MKATINYILITLSLISCTYATSEELSTEQNLPDANSACQSCPCGENCACGPTCDCASIACCPTTSDQEQISPADEPSEAEETFQPDPSPIQG